MIKKAIFIILFLIPTLVLAGGYQVRLQGNIQNGMGLIGTPFYKGASNIFYNPGGLAFMEKQFEVSVGASFVMANVLFQDSYSDYSAKTDNPLSTPAYLYTAYKITDKLIVGLGIYTPYGSTTKWDDDWKGRYLIQSISLVNICFQPTVSYKINDKIGIGAGLIISTGTVEINKAINKYDGASLKLTGNAKVSYGVNVGAMVKITDKITMGIDYRSQITLRMENGDAEIDANGSKYLPMAVKTSDKFSSKLPTPHNVDLGISYQVTEKFLIAAEIGVVLWSAYDSLIIEFDKNVKLNSHNPRKYSNSLIFRIGGEYKINDDLTLRAGSYYDNSPAHDDYFTPETVTQNSLGLTLGLSYSPIKNLTIDASYLHVTGLEKERSYKPDGFTGKYKVISAIPGLGIKYNF